MTVRLAMRRAHSQNARGSCREMLLRTCRVSLRDADGIVHSVQVQGETLFEAAATAAGLDHRFGAPGKVSGDERLLNIDWDRGSTRSDSSGDGGLRLPQTKRFGGGDVSRVNRERASGSYHIGGEPPDCEPLSA